MPFSMSASVRVSMEEVASSKMSTGGSATAARAMASSWRWPWLRLAPSAVTIVSYPWGRRRMKESALAILAACSISSCGGIQLAEADVVRDGAGKQVGILQHDAQGAAQIVLA